MISVIIVTKNRDEALRNISLPSLLRQNTADFEVILWDASDSEKSRFVAEKYGPHFEKKGVDLRYFRAPRIGSASQRNDAVAVARGSVFFFVDDDSEVSTDGVQAIGRCFSGDPDLLGAGLRVVEIPYGTETAKENQEFLFPQAFKEKLYSLIGYKKKRKVSVSGSAKGIDASSGPAEWLSGGSMAFRSIIFLKEKFDERLETFGAYAMCEDVEFSHRIFLKYKYPLMIAPQGLVLHRPVPGKRFEGSEEKAAMYFYNRYLTMRTASVNAPLVGGILFFWTMIRLWKKIAKESGAKIAWKGLRKAWREVVGRNVCK